MKPDYFPSVFDASMLAAWKSCPQLFNLIYLEDWKAKEENVHRHAGKSFASGIEAAREAFFAQNKSAEDSVAEGLEVLIRSYGTFECPADSAKSLERMAGAFEYYFEHYPLERDLCPPVILPSGRLGIEFSFAEPLPITHPLSGDPILYCGRMDAILHYAGQPYVVDEKTTSSLGPTWSRQWDLRAQFTGYAWGCQRSGVTAAGTIIRGVSILKTKYDTQEAVIVHPQWQIDRWYDETLEHIEDVIRAWKRGRFTHNLGDTCASYGGCAFRQVCSVQSESAESFLSTYFQRKRWDPVVREETVL